MLKKIASNVERSSLRAPLQNGLYKNKHLKQHETRRTTRHNRLSENNYFVFCFHFH